MTSTDHDFLFKIVLIGDSGAGKSSLLIKFCDGEFSDTFISTIGVDFKFKNITSNDKTCKLQIWDTAGQDKFRSITRNFYRGAHGVILVYDITDRASFERIKTWMDEVKYYAPPNVPMLLVGAKSDLVAHRSVQYEIAKEFADTHNMSFIETSSKTGTGVDEAFIALSESMIKKQVGKLVGDFKDKKKINGKSLGEKKVSCCSIM